MLTLLSILAAFLIPAGLYLFKEYRRSTPKHQWPVLASALGLGYTDDPMPTIAGEWHGKRVAIAQDGERVRAWSELARPSRLRIEIGPRDVVTRRAGVLVPDPVPTGDGAFEERFLARCNDKAAGAAILDQVLRQRLLSLPHVDILGQGDAAVWFLPELKDPDTLEHVCDVLTVIAMEMERFPA